MENTPLQKPVVSIEIKSESGALGTAYIAHAFARFLAQEGYKDVILTSQIPPHVYPVEHGKLLPISSKIIENASKESCISINHNLPKDIEAPHLRKTYKVGPTQSDVAPEGCWDTLPMSTALDDPDKYEEKSKELRDRAMAFLNVQIVPK